MIQEENMNKELVWDRWCTKCGWRGGSYDLVQDESTESYYRCPNCGADSDNMKLEQWHIGNKIYKVDTQE